MHSKPKKITLKLLRSICLLLILLSVACKQNQELSEHNFSSVGTNRYETKWKKIAKMEQAGLGKQIIEAADSILLQAHLENNSSQIFKALAFRSKYIHLIEEEADIKIIQSFENQIDSSDFPTKQLLHSALAELYQQYAQKNRGRFSKRKKVKGQSLDHLPFWSSAELLVQIDFHYQASLSQAESMKKLPIDFLEPIIYHNGDSLQFQWQKQIRPGIYDFLLQRAIAYYKQELQTIGRFSFLSFEMQQAFFAPVADFLVHEFDSMNLSIAEKRLLQAYQSALATHMKDEKPEVFIDFNLDRLRHYYTLSGSPEADSLYLKALKRLSDQYSDPDEGSEIRYQIAKLYFQWGNKYNFSNPQTNLYRRYLKKAHRLCSILIQDSVPLLGKAFELKQNIERGDLHLKTEKVYLPENPLLFQIRYKNLDTVYFKIVKMPFQTNFNQLRPFNREVLKERLLQQKAARSWTEVLSESKDFQNHQLELYTPELENGNYYLMASDRKNFRSAAYFSMVNFAVSRISYFSRANREDGSFEIYIRDRASGQLLKNAYMNVFKVNPQATNTAEEWQFDRAIQADEKGFIRLSKKEKFARFHFYLYWKSDSLMSYYQTYLNSRTSSRSQLKTYFYTDRAIYRPGQTVHFKGLVIERSGKQTKIKTNHSIRVKLYNASGEEIAQINRKTNDYGSYHGSFILPENGLSGSFRIQDEYNMHRFRVEEYKRPTFKIELNQSADQLKLNQEQQIRGKVIAYSSEVVSQAKISYRIYREVYWPIRPLGNIYPPTEAEKIIDSGVLTAAADGSFSFPFSALSSSRAASNNRPIYRFRLSIDATSKSGETQTATKHFKLTHQALFLSAELQGRIQFKALKNLRIEASNIHGKQVDAKVDLELNRLQNPEKVKIPKRWEHNDQKLIPEKQYRKLFPEYNSHANQSLQQFEVDYLVSSARVDCNRRLNLFKQLPPGAYELKAQTKDAFGNTVKWKKRFILFDEKDKKLAFPMFHWFQALNEKAEVGDTVRLLIGTALPKLPVLFEVEVNGQVFSHQWIDLKNEQKVLSVPVTEDMRGNFTLRLSGIHSNRFFQEQQEIYVPYSNKKLKLKLSSFRSHIEPSAKEKWTLELQSPDSKLDAEVLLSMYDASLDRFVEEPWKLDLYFPNRSRLAWNGFENFALQEAISWRKRELQNKAYPNRTYPQLNWFGLHLGGYWRRGDVQLSLMKSEVAADYEGNNLVDQSAESESVVETKSTIGITQSQAKQSRKAELIPWRSDFRETVFFYPQKTTDDSGRVFFSFQMPDALTSWKFRALAHSKDLKIGQMDTTVRSFKKLMLKPNYPRFLREGDTLDLKALVYNLSDKALNVQLRLEIKDIQNDQTMDLFLGDSGDHRFDLASGKSQVGSWKIAIPSGLNKKAINLRFSAHSNEYADGEEKWIPILSNRILLTESLPLFIQGNQKKSFQFEKLLQSNSVEELQHHAFTFEFTPNPAWYALQAFPVLLEGENENTEQLFARFFANTLAASLLEKQPELKNVIRQWKQLYPEALKSDLEKNQALKTILLKETPWLQKAKSETEQKRRLVFLLDMNRMAAERNQALQKLQAEQLPNGAWPWVFGMQQNQYISRYILEGLGKLRKLQAVKQSSDFEQMLEKGLQFIDRQIEADYKNLLQQNAELKSRQLSYRQIHYFYIRSFFSGYRESVRGEAQQYFLNQMQKHWNTQNPYMKAMIALNLHRLSESDSIPKVILTSLRDQSIQSETEGMYWKSENRNPYWHQSPIASQALIIEAFQEITEDQNAVEQLKLWLLRQKQYAAWSNTKATVQACYALLNQAEPLLQTKAEVEVKLGQEKIDLKETKIISATNYFQKTWLGEDVNHRKGMIEVDNKGASFAWGAAYWQYELEASQVKSGSVDGLKIQRNYFRQKPLETGMELLPLGKSIPKGERITVRMTIENDRDLEFVHLKDMRSPAFEPIEQISAPKFQDGLSYYLSFKDTSTDFYFDWLPKGSYVLEYEVSVSQSGTFSTGIAKIQSHYAPEFSAQTEGKMLKIENK